MFIFDLQRPSAAVVALGAHCDDIEIGCGATLGALARARPALPIHCWLFSGACTPRADESRDCLDRLLGRGRAQVQIFDFRDGFFPAQWGDIKERFRDLTRGLDASLVFTHRHDDAHQDHRVLSELVGNHFRRHTVLEYEIVKYDGDLGRPNLFVPLSRAQLNAKIDALMAAFPTQAGKHWFTRDTFEGIARLRGIECNAPSGFAEAFYSRKVVLDADLPFGPP